jgi:predicted nucleic acid-binding Zn ribbon protein
MTSRGHLGELIDDVLRRHNLDRRARAQSAVTLWPEIVGADIARNAWPISVAQGTLLVGAANHAWAQTLHLMKQTLLEALGARIGADTLSDIQVRVTPRPRTAPATREQASAPERAQLPRLTREDQQRIHQLTDTIADAELRRKVRRAAIGLMRLRRWREAQGRRCCARCGRPLLSRRRVCPACAAGR